MKKPNVGSNLVELFVDVLPRFYTRVADIEETKLPDTRQKHTVNWVWNVQHRLKIVLGTEDVERIVVYRDVVYDEQYDNKPCRDSEP